MIPDESIKHDYILSIEDLDKTLNFLYYNQSKMWDTSDIYKSCFQNNQQIDIENIIDKLSREKLVYSRTTTGDGLFGEYTYSIYSISFDGILFFESASIKGFPFKSIMRQKRRNKRYNALKTIAIVINALAILSIGYLTFHSDDKSSQLQQDISQQKQIIDSLSKIIKLLKK